MLVFPCRTDAHNGADTVSCHDLKRFARWHGQCKLAPAWRIDIQDRAQYPRRSLVTQYQESDFAFAERLMSEEGLF